MPASDLAKVIWHNLVQTPIGDRIFYVPFWECPYRCEFCCVDSLPGRPPADLAAGEAMLFALIAEQFRRTGVKQALHIYGGEPLIKAKYIEDFGVRALLQPGVKKLYLYSTLRPPGAERCVEAWGRDNVRIVVNRDTATDKVHEQMARLQGVAEFYSNPTVFHTGRGRKGEAAYQERWFEHMLPASLPGRSCFANASGLLVNGAHGTVHLCCLPQSPVIADFSQAAATVLDRQATSLASFHKEIKARMRDEGHIHACSVCEAHSRWDTRVAPTFKLVDGVIAPPAALA